MMGKIKKTWCLEGRRVGGDFHIFLSLRCERQCLNADGKKPVERKRVPIQGREEGQWMGQGLRGEEGPGGLPGSRVTAAATESREDFAFQRAGRNPFY